MARERPDFIAATGDLADYGQPEELVAYRDAITGLSVPVASVPGNHDHLSVLVRDAIDTFFREWATRDNPEGITASDAFQREFFRGDWRRPNSGRAPWLEVMGPLYYSFDWGGVHVVMYDGEGRRRYGDDYPQDAWLAADLAAVAPDTPVFVGTHFPETREFYRAPIRRRAARRLDQRPLARHARVARRRGRALDEQHHRLRRHRLHPAAATAWSPSTAPAPARTG